ncbi:LacI family DNA-binding transcriptional regulator [Rathayibacter soli]|uniref:LacI family DNA-binding transcriptional regulator n=1 Tax=Rathayibacter soli TaxID=3144168 RepID=UPI0027E4871D|nr:LacI family DNA-binding transcriptional regulator [Glaciibacter superstes]
MTDQAGPVTLTDVAKHAGVSLATASRALNGSKRVVNAALQARVIAAATELHYTANAQAQAVARGTSRTVAVVLGDIADPYFASIAAGVIRIAEERKYMVTMAATGVELDRELSTLATLKGQRPRVLIMAGSRRTDEEADLRSIAELAGVERLGGRVVFIGSAPDGFRAVRVENQLGGAMLANALAEIGYRDFAILAGPETLVTPTVRAAGFAEALSRRGLSLAPGRLLTGAFSRQGGYQTTRQLLDAGARPECIFAATDVMAVGSMAAIREHGLIPGRDIGVAGFDDIEMLQDVTPALTTVSLPLAEIGARALELALSDEVDEADNPPIEGHVVLRDSTPRLGQ